VIELLRLTPHQRNGCRRFNRILCGAEAAEEVVEQGLVEVVARGVEVGGHCCSQNLGGAVCADRCQGSIKHPRRQIGRLRTIASNELNGNIRLDRVEKCGHFGELGASLLSGEDA
jgi:hypothetical protein